jgi:cytochrome b561
MRTTEDYGSAAKLFHWATVALLAAQLTLGWVMPNIKRGMQPERLMNLHLSLGLLILALMTARAGWRLVHGAPPPEATLPAWQRIISQLVHGALYLLVFAMTFTGWFFASMRGWEITVFGAFPVPRLVAQGSSVGRMLGELHATLVWVLLAAIGLHVAAALAHYLIFRDRVLQRMLPRFGR